MVSERSLAVLRVIVQDYVETREPVGSKSIAERHAFGVSSATIRNDMAQLEEDGLISAPHTSSGRIPTDKGYRAFVDQLTELRPLSSAQRVAIESFLSETSDLDEVLSRTVRLLSGLTNQVALAQYPSFGSARVRHIEVVSLGVNRVMTVLITDTGRVDQHTIECAGEAETLAKIRERVNQELDGLTLADASEALGALPELFEASSRESVEAVLQSLSEQIAASRHERLVMAGAANLARTERDFPGSIYPVLEAIEEQVTILKLFSEMELDPDTVATRIGHENIDQGLSETSVLASGYAAPGGSLARIGVLGPTRMDYLANMEAVRAVARYLSRLLADDEPL